MKALVVYYSRSGNTRRVAEIITNQLQADLQELVDLKGRAGLLGWLRAGRDAMGDKTTDLEPLVFNLDDYDLIVVGSPVWASHPASAVSTFLQSQDLSGKLVALFCTMSARGGEETCAVMKSLIPGVKVVGHLTVAMKKETADEIDQKITRWIAQLKGGE
ncbi:flavodoxin family protein [Candidatus Zixiibacteriota bacterium]